MFALQCDQTTPHLAHEHIKRWRKVQLPHLKSPDLYPDSWNAWYRCPGVEAWYITYLHQECPVCMKCADVAVTMANSTGFGAMTYRETEKHTFGLVGHSASINRMPVLREEPTIHRRM